ncbi:SDR family NAD(P)-dependent oxidoreductase [Actinacidiphila sp. ITFR-21]|uniref:SDR family NAD(P)-dependent oxidoreductase n=1 Tax=Actinacidiphila sp. ITFR-21 TaxID=3075199 RepID=UPI00288988BB|nr:SDR family oxidoreductase [Streptomyces sp. ITFR-21]WNI19015.1 SDR family oxidoreductase [Streptomyces sp. ITFR-21]
MTTAGRPSALITGGSRGIGLGVASALAARGWGLTLCARDPARLAAAGAELRSLGGRVESVAGDAADEACLAAAVDRHEAAYGSMNALVLAAGVGSAGPLAGYPVRRIDKQFAVNVRAPFVLVGRALPLLRAGARDDPARGGRIVALTSIEGVHPEPGLAVYGASKAALISLVRSVNAEEAARGVTASAISPGYVDTDMSAWVADRIPPGSMITVADIVRTVDLVLSLSPSAVIPHLVINRVGGGPYRA